MTDSEETAEDSDDLTEDLALTQAMTDPLTEVATKSHLLHELRGAIEVNERIGLIFCDLVQFKRFNDVHGRMAGDYVLLGVARRLERLVGKALVARYGGEEFAILLRGDEVDELCALGLRLRTALSDEPVQLLRRELTNGPVPIELHVGVAEHAEGMSAEDLMRAADEELQRNCEMRRDRERRRHPRTPET